MERERVILNYSPYGILNRHRNSDGVNNLVQESVPHLKIAGYKVITAGPLVKGKEEDNVADVTMGKAVKIPRPIAKLYGTSYCVPLFYDKKVARDELKKVEPDIVLTEEPFLGCGTHTIMSGMPRREDGKPIPVTINRFHGYLDKWDILAKAAFRMLEIARRPKLDGLGFPRGFTDGIANTIRKDSFGIAVSSVTKKTVNERYKVNCEVIYNGIDSDQFAQDLPIKHEWRESNKKIVFSSGRLEGRKGQKYLIEAISILKKEGYDNFILYLAGVGEDRPKLEDMVKKRGLREDVIFVGNLPWEEYKRALKTADVAVYPAFKGEAFGRAPIEAAASGGLLVVSANDGYSEAVEGMPFVLKAKPMDSDNLARQIKKASEIGEEQKREFGKLNADHVRRTFGWGVTTDRLDNFFEESLKNHGGVDWSKPPSSGTLYERK